MDQASKTALSEEEIEQAQSMVLALFGSEAGLEALRSLVGKGMQPPNQEGLYELLAPDGTLAKVVDGKIHPEELQTLIREDIHRILRPTYLRLLAEEKSVDEINNETFPRFLELKRGYQLARLPSPK